MAWRRRTVHPFSHAARMIPAGVDTVDIDPLTTAIDRFRLTIYIGHIKVHSRIPPVPLRLAGIPAGVTPATRTRS